MWVVFILSAVAFAIATLFVAYGASQRPVLRSKTAEMRS